MRLPEALAARASPRSRRGRRAPGHDRGDGRRKAQKGDQPGNAAWRRNGRDGRLLIIKRTTTRPTSHEGCRPFLQTGQIVFKTLGIASDANRMHMRRMVERLIAAEQSAAAAQ